MITLVLEVLLGWFLIFLIISRRKQRKGLNKLPPGPSGLPLLGNVLQLARNPHLKFSEWATKYGKLYSINIAGKQALVINDVQSMRDIHGKAVSTGKYKFDIFNLAFGPSNLGIINNEARTWHEQQRFCMQALKQLGVTGGSTLEPLMQSEAEELCNWITTQLGKRQDSNVNISHSLMKATSTIIWNVVTGENHESSTTTLVHLLEAWMKAFNKATGSGLVFLPWLKHVIPKSSGYQDFVTATECIHKVIGKSFEDHQWSRKSGDATKLTNDFIDSYLDKVENCKDPASIFYGENGQKHAFWSANSILFGGSESIGHSMNWLISYLIANPEKQENLHSEIDKVLGKDGTAALSDRERLPYLDAVIHETLRKSSLPAYGVPHQLLDDMDYSGYMLPKGTILISNIYHANHDPNVWGDPELFRPERFWDGNSFAEKIKLKDYVATFQEGRRKCPGEHMAKDFMFLLTSKLVQMFSFHPVDGRCKDEYQIARVGFTLLAPDFGFRIKTRT